MAFWIGAQGELNWVKNSKTCLLCEVTKRKPHTQIKKFFNRNQKTCWIGRWFEELSTPIGWRVIALQTFAKILEGAGLKGSPA